MAVSSDEIRNRYFGADEGRPCSSKDSAAVAWLVSADGDLTPSAKYVAKEARRRLGQHQAFEAGARPNEEDLKRLVLHVEESEAEQLGERERTAVIASLSSSLEHYDVLSPLVENPEVNDIIIRSYRDVSIQVRRTNVQTDIRFPDTESYKAFVENLLKRVGKSCTTATPVVDAAIDPHVRACVTHESFSPPGSGPMLTLRIARHRAISLEGLVQFELAPRVVMDYIAAIVSEARATLLIAGEVGTGKTTLVKALATRVSSDEAILIIEDTHELALERPFVRTLLTREANTEGAGRIAPAQAIRTGMRMAMNRVILGEMRDAEAAEAFIDVCASGHAGMSTIHARSARDALSRLELFLARAQGNVSVEAIRRQIANAVSAVVFIDVERETGKRRIAEVFEVGASSDGAIQVSPMFTFAPQNGQAEWRRESGISQFQEALKRASVVLPRNGDHIGFDLELLYRAHNHVRE